MTPSECGKITQRILTSPEGIAVLTQGLRTLLLVGYLLLSTRILGPEGYGRIAAAVSIAALFGHFVGLGSGVAKVRDAARDPSAFPAAWGLALLRYAFSGAALAVLFALTALLVFGDQMAPATLVLIGTSELMFFPLCTVSAYAFLAMGYLRTAAFIQLLAPGFKALLLYGWVLITAPPDINGYAWLMATGSGIGAVACLALASRRLPKPQWPQVVNVFRVRQDALFSVSNLTNQAVTELDKPMTLHFAGAVDAGLYGAAARIFSTAAIPMTAIIQSQARRLFAFGPGITSNHLRFLRIYGYAFFLYGALSGGLLWLASPWLGPILGDGFSGSAAAVPWLCLWLPLQGLRQLAGAILTSSDKVRQRIRADLLALSAFAASALLLIPSHGITGTAMSLVLAECVWLLGSLRMLQNH